MAPGAPWSGPKSPRANCKLVVTGGLKEPEPGASPRLAVGEATVARCSLPEDGFAVLK